MSFILDALKKSDQERQRATVPGVQTMHAPAAVVVRRRLWPYALLAVAVIGVVAIVVQWPASQMPPSKAIQATTPAKLTSTTQPSRRQPVTVAPASPVQGGISAEEKAAGLQDAAAPSSPEVPHAPATVEDAGGGQAAAEEPVEWIEIKPPQPEAMDQAPEITETPDETTIPSVHGLPPSVQQQLPRIEIAAQIYDSDPSARMAIINDRTFREGQMVAPGLVLETIAEDGIILSFQGQRFRMDVFQSWSGN